MAKQRYINTKIWTDSWYMDLDATEKLLFLYLLTNPNTNIAGIYEISMKQMAFDTNIDQEALRRLLSRFQDANKVYFEIGWIVIKNFVKHQSLNPKIAIGICREIDDLPDWLRLRITNKDDILYLNLHSLFAKHGIAYHRLSHSNTNIIKYNSNTNSNSNSADALVKKADDKSSEDRTKTKSHLDEMKYKLAKEKEL